MPPIVMIIAIIVYIASLSFKRGRKVRRAIEKIALFWLIGFFMFAFVKGVVSGSESVKNHGPVLRYCFRETALDMLFLYIVLMKNAIRKFFGIKDHVMEDVISDRELKMSNVPDSAAARSSVVRKFNEQFGLNLTIVQIKRIVDCSFDSAEWALEIGAMTPKYAALSEWYADEMGWLRAYLKAFNTNDLAADMTRQKDYCLRHFKDALSTLDANAYIDVASYIEDINRMCMTNFDEASFMIAYRFLSKAGIRVAIPKASTYRVTSEIDELARKYDEADETKYKQQI